MWRIIYLLFGLFFIIICFPVSVFSQNMRSGGTVVLAREEVIDDDYFAAGDSVTILGTVNGDVYAAGGNVVIEGVVNGDVLAAGGTVTINGTVRDDVRVAGGQVTVSGKVGRNVTAGAGNLSISRDATILGSATVGGGNVMIDGNIANSARIGGGTVLLGSVIGKNVVIGSDNLTVTKDTRIGGNLEYYANERTTIDQAASISGVVKKNVVPEQQRTRAAQNDGDNFGSKLVGFLMSLVVGLLLLRFLGKASERVVAYMQERPWMSLGVGIGSLVAIPVIFLLLLVTILGIPVAIALLTTYFFVLYLSHIFTSYYLGKWLMAYINKPWSAWAVFVLGLGVYSLLTWIPVVGVIVGLFSVLFGSGALIMTFRLLYFDLKSKELI